VPEVRSFGAPYSLGRAERLIFSFGKTDASAAKARIGILLTARPAWSSSHAPGAARLVITIERSGRDSGLRRPRDFSRGTAFDRNQCGFPATIVGSHAAWQSFVYLDRASSGGSHQIKCRRLVIPAVAPSAPPAVSALEKLILLGRDHYSGGRIGEAIAAY
jgi:hypothetical protein